MAKPIAPLLSFGASGAIAKTMVFSKWKGREYVRRYVIPANPQSAAQTLTRNTFGFANSVWKGAGSDFISTWNLFATGRVLTGRNAFMGQMVSALRTETDLLLMPFSPGAKGGLAATSVTPTAGSLQISAVVTAPTPPTGWTLTSAVGAVIRDQDPQSGILFTLVEVEDVAAPFDLIFTGLTASVLYVGGVWLKWAKPDGSVAYGPSINFSDTPLV